MINSYVKQYADLYMIVRVLTCLCVHLVGRRPLVVHPRGLPVRLAWGPHPGILRVVI